MATMTQTPRTTISKKSVLLAEIAAVTSQMRKNARWATSTTAFSERDSALAESFGLRVSGPSVPTPHASRINRERELMAGFNALKRAVNDVGPDLKTLPLTQILAPFFAIIRSPLSTGLITSASLSALHTFFTAGLITSSSSELEPALADLSSIVSNCKFEASDSAGDEVVMLKILTVIEDALCGPVAERLGDVEVCEMLETVLTTCCQMRLSEILRRSAERSMISIVRSMAHRLTQLDPAVEEDKLQRVKMTVSAEPQPPAVAPPLVADSASEVPTEETAVESSDVKPEAETMEPEEQPMKSAVSDGGQFVPYGLPAMVELLRVLINILDPSDKLHTDLTRMVALRLLIAFFEVSGSHLSQFPSLATLICDHGCRYLFQLARSENPSLLQLALRTIATAFEIMRSSLKLQQELFFTFAIDRLSGPPPSQGAAPGAVRPGNNIVLGRAPRGESPVPRRNAGSPALDARAPPDSPAPQHRAQVLPARGEVKELLLDVLSQLSNYPSFMVDLYVNYDCDINCENLFDRLIDYATTSIYGVPAGPGLEVPLQNSQYYCLEILLSAVDHMARRAEGHTSPWQSDTTTPELLLQAKARKNQVTLGANLFNTKPKSGIAFLEENGLIYADLSDNITRPQSLARFLKSSTRLDKKVLGEFLGKPENLDVLKAFIGLFDFKDKPVADAMREMLEAFRLPGESQQIDRIAEAFAEVYFAASPEGIKDKDAVYVIAFSIIMLNTDQHNAQVKKRMTLEAYSKNLRGVNGGQDFPPEFLEAIYESIRKKEIIMPEEHIGQVGFEYAWRELLARSRIAGPFVMSNTGAFDIEMFKSVWQPLISAISHAFMSFDDDYVIERAIAGFRQCATLAGHFRMADVFDHVVVTLSQTTTLLWEHVPAAVPNYPVVDVGGQNVTVSGLSVKFGTNVKAQLAAVVLFNIVNGNGNALREGWTQIFEMFENLFVHSLLPTRMLQMEDFLGGVSMIPLRGAQPPKPPPRNEGGGLLSALSSYLMNPYTANAESVPEATDADVESTLSTIDCIATCRLDELYAQIIYLDAEALVAAIRALEALAHERTVARLKQESDEPNAPPTNTLSYDPVSVFLLEAMVSIACQTPQHIEEVWPVIMEHLTALLSTPQQYSILLVERAVVGLLRLGRILATKPNLRDQLYVSFDLLAGLHPTVRDSIAEQIVRGLLIIIKQDKDIMRSPTEWNIVFSVLRSTLSSAEAAAMTFDFVSNLLKHQDDTITSDNYAVVLLLLDEFATLAGTATEVHAQQRRKEPPLVAATSPVVARGLAAIDMVHELKDQMSQLLQQTVSSPEQRWRQYCVPLLASLARQCSNASREVRTAAMTHLQRLVLGPLVSVVEGGQRQIEELFSRVIFPMLDDLLKPTVYARDPVGMAETRLRASTFLCKAFMHFEVREGNQADIRVLWIQVLDLLDRLMHADRRDQMHEAIPESLKNVVLVMQAADIIVPPTQEPDQRSERQQALWAASQERIERFLPGFLDAVIAAPQYAATTASAPNVEESH